MRRLSLCVLVGVVLAGSALAACSDDPDNAFSSGATGGSGGGARGGAPGSSGSGGKSTGGRTSNGEAGAIEGGSIGTGGETATTGGRGSEQGTGGKSSGGNTATGQGGEAGDEGVTGGSAGKQNQPQPPPSSNACPDVGLDPSQGNIRYVCDCGEGAAPDCQPGDDSADGSEGSPWRSYDRALEAFGQLAPGDSIAFCRGGVFVPGGEGGSWANGNCKADQPCIVRDYGSEALDRPLFLFNGRSGFTLDNGGDAEHEEGYIFMNLALRGSDQRDGFFFYNDIDDVLVCNVAIDRFLIGVHMEGSNDLGPGSNGLNERIVLRNSTITNCAGQGWLGSGNGSSIEYNYFENNGYAEAIYNHNIYLNMPSKAELIQGMRVIGNELYKSAMVGGECQGVSLVVHGRQEGLLIEGNTVREDIGAADAGCWGIAVDTGYDSAESFANTTIRGNVVINVGNVGIGVNACPDCVVENNIVIAEQPTSMVGAIAVPDRERSEVDPLATTRAVVRNNTVFMGEDSRGVAILLGGEGTEHRAVSNAVHYAGSNPFSCFDFGLGAQAYSAIDYNLCYAPNAGNAEWVRSRGDLDAWRGDTGFDENSLSADPLFRAVGGTDFDYTPQAGSPLIGAGSPDGSTAADQAGTDRGDTPSIGALEP